MDIDIKELMKAATEALNSEKFKGDVVGVKYVENEIGNVEPGGIGVQKVYNGANGQIVNDGQQVVPSVKPVEQKEREEEMFLFVHPALDEEQGWLVHDAVRRLVKRQGLQMICQYLMQLKKENRVLLPPNPSVAYAELVRMGMPTGDGFAEKTFGKYYNK